MKKISLLLIAIILFLVSCKELNEIDFIPLVADFAPSQSIAQVGDTILFNQKSSAVAKQFEWSFGDGSNSQEPNPEKVYTQFGLFNVKLTSIKADGTTQTEISKNVRILPNSKPGKDTLTIGEINTNELGYTFAPITIGQTIVGYIVAGSQDLNSLYIEILDINFKSLSVPQKFVYSNFNNGLVVPKDIIRTLDGGFLVAGYFTYNSNERDSFILKIDTDGNEDWRVINATGRNEEYNSITQVNNGFLIVAGTVSNVDATGQNRPIFNLDIFSPSGILENNLVFGNNWTLNKMIYTSEGEFAIAMTEVDKPTLIIYNAALAEPQKIQLPFKGQALGLIELNDNAYALVGERTHSSDSTTSFIARIDKFSNQSVWRNDTIAFYKEKLIDVAQTSSGDVIALGIHYNPLTKNDVLLMKFDPNGALTKLRILGGKNNDEAYKIFIAPPVGGFSEQVYILGSTQSFGKGSQANQFNIYTIKLNTDLE